MGVLPVLLGRRIGVARRVALAVAATVALALLCVVAVFTDLERRCTPEASQAGPMSGAIPDIYVDMYGQSASIFGVNRFLLAALHKQETDFGRSRLPGVTSGVNTFGCCAGPMQFNLHDTWAAHADAYRKGTRPGTDYPQRASEHPSVYDPFDAIMAAGHKLAADGADTSLTSAGTRAAVLAYNRDPAYVAAVLTQAQQWERAATKDTADTSARLRWPVDSTDVTSPFGPRAAPCSGCSANHQGIDIAAAGGAPVRAAADGQLIRKANVSGYGNQVCLRHASALVTCYAHLSSFASQSLGDDVTAGAVIGAVGSTGSSTGPHLHFEARRGTAASSTPVDPAPYLANQVPTPDELAAACVVAQLNPPPSTTPASRLAWPTAGGAVIGHSNAPDSTHDPRTWPTGWQSDNALDIAIPTGTPVIAVADGTICPTCGFGASSSSSPQLAGQRLTLRTADNAVYYAHLSRLVVRPGQRVTRGQLLGYSGAANGVAHLHIALQHGRPEDVFGSPTTEEPA